MTTSQTGQEPRITTGQHAGQYIVGRAFLENTRSVYFEREQWYRGQIQTIDQMLAEARRLSGLANSGAQRPSSSSSRNRSHRKKPAGQARTATVSHGAETPQQGETTEAVAQPQPVPAVKKPLTKAQRDAQRRNAQRTNQAQQKTMTAGGGAPAA
jgi:hypothetical protein